MPSSSPRDRNPPAFLRYEAPAAIKKKKRVKPKVYEVAKILKVRTKAGEEQYRIRWKGYEEKDDTWESAKNCSCSRLVKAFKKDAAKKPKDKAEKKKTAGKKAASKKKGKPVARKGTVKTKKPAAKKAAAKKPKPAKKSAKKSASAGEAVDEHAEVDRGTAVLPTFTTSLKYIDLEQNSDKFYIIQVLYKDDDSWLYTRWGRSGTNGDKNLEGPIERAEAIDSFNKKYQEKTGKEWGSSGANVPGKYWPITVAASKDGEGSWEYYLEGSMDGKEVGWHKYDIRAMPIVEAVFIEWRNNPTGGLNVRCVQSGHFSYRVDFDKMEQTNLTTNKQRPIRRV